MKKYGKPNFRSLLISAVLTAALSLGFSFGTAAQTQLIPGGESFGVKFFTEGAVVVGIEEVQTEQGAKNPAADAGLQPGDVIISAGDCSVQNNEQLSGIISASNGEKIKIKWKRNGEENTTEIVPALEKQSGQYRLGLWIRDNSAGVGTVTFYNPQDCTFGALGHGICDVDTGILMPLRSADVFYAEIFGINKGASGTPGELKGMFLDDQPLGKLSVNCDEGVFGKADSLKEFSKTPVDIASEEEICQGKASIFCTLDNTGVKEYEVEIIKINRNKDRTSKNMLIKVTDPVLLEKTGGIVQGMSGSPIIQNGKIIGAVTHVLVNDPTKGYGIFIENMLQSQQELKKAS